mgnify:CR=1 FL=1
MKLKLKAPSKKSKTPDRNSKTEVKKRKKEDNAYRSKKYALTECIKFAEMDTTINNLTYGHIINCDINRVNISGDIIEIDQQMSWVGLILLMLDTVRVNAKDDRDFLNILMDKEVTDQTFCVDKRYGKYTFDKEAYKAYNLFDSGFYVESTFNYEIIYKVIINLAKILKIEPEQFSVHLIHKEFSKLDILLEELEESAIAVSIRDALPYFKDGIFLMDISITNTSSRAQDLDTQLTTGKTNKILSVVKAHHIQEVLMIFLNYVYDTYDEKDMMKLVKLENESTYLRTSKTADILPSMQIRNSKFEVYSDLNIENVLKFIEESMKTLKMDKDDIKLYFRKRKGVEELKEWELE